MMILTKLKVVLLTTAAVGLAAAGSGVVAQEPGPEVQSKVGSPDRLEAIERKLDRMMESMAAPQVPKPEATWKTAGPPRVVRVEPAQASAATAADRVVKLEQRLDALEHRIERLERQQGGVPVSPPVSLPPLSQPPAEPSTVNPKLAPAQG